VDTEPLGPRCDGKLPVVRRHCQGIELVPHEESAGEMDRIERTDDRRERPCCPLEDRRAERHQGETVDRFQDRGSAIGYVVIVEAEAEPRAIDRAEALEPESSLDTAVVIFSQILRRPGSPRTTWRRTDESTYTFNAAVVPRARAPWSRCPTELVYAAWHGRKRMAASAG
jgi:hypothetical protein